ncbi:MAG: 30S ribosomal protein S4e [Nanoarchaeota archaeon]
MTKRHLFALNAPLNWPISRKDYKWVTRPNPGPHPLKRCLPVILLLKGLLNYAKTAREVRRILQNRELLIDKRIIKDQKFPLGIMDNIEIKSKNECFRLFINSSNKYQLKKINEDESKLKLCKIINKKILKKGIIQLNFYDGRNILVEKDAYKTGDTLVIDLENNKIVSHLKLENGAFVYLIGGKYIGNIGKVESITVRKGLQAAKILLKCDNKNIETLKEYAFVIDKDTLKV